MTINQLQDQRYLMTTQNKKGLSAHSIKLNKGQSIPVYRQLKAAISAKIVNGEWRVGDLIPSENQLSVELKVSRMTVNRALRELASQSLLRRVHGLGTFVAEPPRQASLIELRSIADEIHAQGKHHHAEVLILDQVSMKDMLKSSDMGELAQSMDLPPNAPLFRIKLVHYQDSIPIQLESRLVNPAKVPGFISIDFTEMTPTEYLISQIRPDEREHIVQAILPDGFLSCHLNISGNEPCLKLKRRTWHENTIVTSAHMIYPSSRYDLGARFTSES